MPWLSVSGDVRHDRRRAEAATVTVLVDSTGLAPGVHEGHLCVSTNDPDEPAGRRSRSLVTVTDQTCDRTITGNHTGPLTVSSGLTCLAHGSVVTGPVSVGAGASMHATGATVVGPVRADRRGERWSCTGRTLVGPVTLRDGTTQVALIGNHITGPVSVDRNVTGPTPIVVAANTIIGPLGCAGNEPPPVNNAQPNNVTGPKSGQCRDL